MNSSLSFDSFFARVTSLFNNEQFVDAWEALVQYGSLYEDHRCEVDYLRMCVTSRMGKPELAAHIFDSALGAGVWYSDDLLLAASDLEPLRQLSVFTDLIARSRRLRDEEEESLSELVLKEPQMGSDYLPLLIALHDDQSSARRQVSLWLDLAEHGFLLAFPQAAHGIMRGSYRWGDEKEVEEVFRDHIERVNRAYWVDMDRVLMGGIGRGGQHAVTTSLARVVTSAGFIAVRPTLSDELVTHWLDLAKLGGETGSRGVFIEDNSHDGVRDALIQRFMDEAVPLGISCLRIEVPDTAASFRVAAAAAVPSAAAFILKRSSD